MKSIENHGSLLTRVAAAALVFVIAFAVYLMTLTPTVALVDSGELTIAAWCLGNAHPPGFPLFLLLTHLATLFPIGTVAWRANLACAFFSAIAGAMMALAFAEIALTRAAAPLTTPNQGRSRQERRRREREAKPASPPAPARAITSFELALLMIATGLLLAFSRTLWAYATLTEVYALNTAMMMTIFWLMLSWRRRVANSGTPGRDHARFIGWLYAAALTFGLALGVHHVTVGLGILGIAVLVGRTAGWTFYRSKQLAVAAAISISALLIYAYLPIAASRMPVMNWSNPNTLGRVLQHVTAQQYHTYISSSSQAAQLDDFVRFLLREMSPPWLPLALLLAAFGLYRLFRRDRTAFWFLALVAAADFGWVMIYPIVNDKDAYLLPTFVAVTLAAACGVRELVSMLKSPTASRIAATAALVLPVIAFGFNYRFRDRSRFMVAKDYTENAFRAMEHNALLLTGDWELYSPMMYFIEVEKRRTDVEVVETGFLLRRWYFEHLQHRHPALVAASRGQLDAYLPLVDKFENAQDEWAQNEALRQQFNQRVDDLIMSMIEQHLKRGPVYATVDLAFSREPRDQNLVKRLTAAYDVVPRGVVMQIMPGHTLRPLAPLEIETRGLVDGTVAYEPDDVVPTEVLPIYRAAFLMRARYFAATKHLDEAIASYQRARTLDPSNPMIEQELSAVARAKQ
ncbi:MAG TPA: DUF2723 domain-containing protein [Thermoanaerobaculia bacterium]|nr:DUF2723 domain-containing protein [Thermoanaerobaculia bacterium]